MRGGKTCLVSVSERHSEGLWNNLLPERQRCVMVPAGNVKQHYYWSNLSAAKLSLRVSRAGPFLTSLFILAQITGCFLPLSLSITVPYFVSCFLTGYTDMGLPCTGKSSICWNIKKCSTFYFTISSNYHINLNTKLIRILMLARTDSTHCDAVLGAETSWSPASAAVYLCSVDWSITTHQCLLCTVHIAHVLYWNYLWCMLCHVSCLVEEEYMSCLK